MHTTRTLPARFARALGHNVAAVAVIASGLMLASMNADADPTAERPFAANTPAALVEAHDCWTGEAPADMAGVVPGHVVVSGPRFDGPVLGGPRLVEQALAQTFDGADHDLTVHGFCR